MYIARMRRTQIFLTESEQAGLQRLAKARGSTVSAVIREAVDQYLQNTETAEWRERRLAAFGLWSNQPVMDLNALRREERFGDWSD